MFVLALSIPSWLLVLGPAIRTTGVSNVAQLVNLVYPVSDIASCVLALLMLSRRREQLAVDATLVRIIVVACLCLATADSYYSWSNLSPDGYVSGSFIDLGWVLGDLLLGTAALAHIRRRRVGYEPGPTVAAGHLDSILAVSIPYLAAVAAMIGVAVDDRRSALENWALPVILLACLTRQALATLETRRVTHTLEDRVDARTRELASREAWFRTLVQNSTDVITVVDAAGRVQYMSPSVTQVFGYSPDRFTGRSIMSVFRLADAGRVLGAVMATVAAPTGSLPLKADIIDAVGRWCQCETTVTSLLDDPQVRGIVLNTRDVSERARLEGELNRRAFTDALTGLANLALFRDRVQHAFTSRREGGRVAVLFVDLDAFKDVNDTLGHAAGDELLVAVGHRMASVVRPGDTVARVGGDEFAVLLSDVCDVETAEEVAQRVVEALRPPVNVADSRLQVRASVGVGLSVAREHPGVEDVPDPDGAHSPEDLLRNADMAMYHAKANASRTSGGTVARFSSHLFTALMARRTLAEDLDGAVLRGEFFLAYQPIVDIASGRVTGAEALLRWNHPRRGVVSPLDFIPIAEESGLIVEIGDWVLREACLQAVGFRAGLPSGFEFSMSINVSSRQLDETLAGKVAEALDVSGLPASALVLEMTESMIMSRTNEILTLLNGLRELGVGLAIDDFGTGYSSLAYLSSFPVDRLKIDRAFVTELGSDEGGQEALEIARAIVSLGLSLGLKVVAEGIETVPQLAVLRMLGVQLGQGWHFGRPLTVAAMADFLRLNSRTDLALAVPVTRVPTTVAPSLAPAVPASV